MPRGKILLQDNCCRAITLAAGAIWKKRESPLFWERGNFGGILRGNLDEGQTLARDSGESIFAARHQDASQGPLGRDRKNNINILSWYHCKPAVAIMAPNFSKLVSKFWKLVSKRKYALTSRKYSPASRKDFNRILLHDFWTNFYFARSPEIIFVDFFFEFAWEFCIEKWRGFLVNFSWCPFPTNKTKHENSSKNFGENRSKIRGKIREETSKNSGVFSFCNFSDLTIFGCTAHTPHRGFTKWY